MSAPSTSQNVIARGVGSNAFSFVIRFAAKASFLYVGARLYGAANYGVFTMATAMVELAVPVASLGLKRMIFPWLEEEAHGDNPRPAMHVVMDALLLAAIAGVIVSAFVVAATSLLPDALVSSQLRFAFAVLAPAVLGQIIGDIALAATRWTHKMRYEVIARGILEPYVLTGVTFAAWYLGLHQTGMLLGYWAGSIVLAAFAVWSARHCLGRLHLRQWRPHPRKLAARAHYLLPASGSDVIGSLAQRIDLYMVGLLLGDAPAGVYGVLRQLRTPILQVRQAFDGILVPLIARTMRATGDVMTGQATAAATRVILTIQLGIVLLIACAGEALLGLFGPQYVVGYTALVMMVLAEAVNSAFGVSELIIYYRRPTIGLAINVAQVIVAVLLVPLLASSLGIAGAATAMFVSAVFIALLRRHWLKQLHIERPPLHAAVPFVSAAMAGLIAYEVVQTFGAGFPWDKILIATAATALYGAAIAIWLRWRPGVLSLAKFRVG